MPFCKKHPKTELVIRQGKRNQNFVVCPECKPDAKEAVSKTTPPAEPPAAEKKMEKNPVPGTTVPSSAAEHFDAHTANIPDVISAGDPEIIPPGQPDKAIETGWPVFDVQQIVELPFFLLKRRYGEVWEIDDEESAAVARAWKPILDKYLPLDETELGTALLVTAAILAPRILVTDWGKEKEKKPTPPANTKTAASGVSPVSSEKENRASQAGWGVFSDT